MLIMPYITNISYLVGKKKKKKILQHFQQGYIPTPNQKHTLSLIIINNNEYYSTQLD